MDQKNSQNMQNKQNPGQQGDACKNACKDDVAKKVDKFAQSFPNKQANQPDKNKPSFSNGKSHA